MGFMVMTRGMKNGAATALVSLFMAASAHAQTKTVTPVLQDDWVQGHNAMVEDAKARADKIKIVFVGDSITARWTRSPGEGIYNEFYAPIGAINLGISADGTQHVLWRMQHGVLDPLHPKMVILLIGTNNLGEDPGDVAYGVWAIVAHIRKTLPEARVLVQGIFPRSDKPELNERIAKVNELIATLDDGKMVKYFYFGDKFLKPDGSLNLDIMTDKVHPNTPDGFKIWHESILPIVKEWLEKAPIPNVPPPPAPIAEPKRLVTSTPEPRNDFLYRHKGMLAISKAQKEKCQLVFMGGEAVCCWDRAPEVFKKEYWDYHPLILAIWGSRPENMLWQVANGELDGIRPTLVLLQSQEGLRGDKPVEELAAGMEATAKLVIEKIPTAKVLLVGAFPIGEKATDPLRKKVAQYNELLSKAADGKTINFLDVGSAFLSPDGSLKKGAVPSHENTSAESYAAWANAQRDTIRKLMEGNSK